MKRKKGRERKERFNAASHLMHVWLQCWVERGGADGGDAEDDQRQDGAEPCQHRPHRARPVVDDDLEFCEGNLWS